MLASINASYEKSITQSYKYAMHNGSMADSPFSGFAVRFVEVCQESHLPDKNEPLGHQFDVSGPMVSYYRTGKKLPSMETALLIAQKTGVCVEWLLTGRGPKYPGPVTNPDDWLDMRGINQDVKKALQAAAKSARNHRNNHH